MRIQEVMSQPVVTCPISGTLAQAAQLMWEHDCGIAPIVNDDGQLVGVVTDRDVCMASYTQGKALHEIPVTTAMSNHVVVARLEDDVEDVEALMRKHKVRRIPVLGAEGRPVGLASVGDLARVAARVPGNGADREVAETLAAVSQPRLTFPVRLAG